MEHGSFARLCERIGPNYAGGDDYALYCGDCLDIMRRLPDASIGLTVTSPPYNIGKEYERVRPLDEYLDWMAEWIAEVYRVTSPDGAFWLNLGYVAVPRRGIAVPLPYLLWDRVPFYLIQEVVWNYGAGVACSRRLSPRNEKFLWYVKNPHDYVFDLDAIRDPDVKYPNQKKGGKLRCNSIGKNPSDVWRIAKVTSGANRSSPERAPHPAQFPQDVIARIVKGFSRPSDIVLDPFAGSGSTSEACIVHGRRSIAIEISPGYCCSAAERLLRADAEVSSRLFKESTAPERASHSPLSSARPDSQATQASLEW